LAIRKKLFVTVLTKQDPNTRFYVYPLSENEPSYETDVENAPHVDKVLAAFNIDSTLNTPAELMEVPHEPHHSSDGEPCDHACICGDSSTVETTDKFITMIKTLEDDDDPSLLLSFRDEPMEEYLRHLAYNEENNITLESFFVDADDDWNPITPLW